MANEFIIKKGLISKANSVVSGSLIVTEGASGSFSGSFEGDGSGLTNVTASFSPTASYALTASYVNPLNQDVEITGSLEVNGDITAAVTDTARLGITLKPSTGITGVTQFAKIQDSNGNDIITRQQGTVNRPHELWIGRNTGYQGDNNIIINGPGNIGSPSFNQTNLGVTSLWVWQGANTYGQYITGRTQDATSTALLVRNWNGSSGVPNYETYFQLRNDKSVLISGSLEVTGSVIVTEGVSGSFSGSFHGDGSGLTGLISSSYSTTSSYALTSISSSYAPIPPTFPFTGDAVISGSLTISGSLLNTGTVSIDDTDSPYTITGTQQFILIDPSGGDVTVNMPDAATYPGRQIFFKITQAAGANTVTIQRQGGDTIDGATTYEDLDIQYESISIVSNGGTGWFIF
jgi:hypothetical protein